MIAGADRYPARFGKAFQVLDTMSDLVWDRQVAEGVGQVTGNADETIRTGLFLQPFEPAVIEMKIASQQDFHRHEITVGPT